MTGAGGFSYLLKKGNPLPEVCNLRDPGRLPSCKSFPRETSTHANGADLSIIYIPPPRLLFLLPFSISSSSFSQTHPIFTNRNTHTLSNSKPHLSVSQPDQTNSTTPPRPQNENMPHAEYCCQCGGMIVISSSCTACGHKKCGNCPLC